MHDPVSLCWSLIEEMVKVEAGRKVGADSDRLSKSQARSASLLLLPAPHPPTTHTASRVISALTVVLPFWLRGDATTSWRDGLGEEGSVCIGCTQGAYGCRGHLWP